MIGPSDGNTFLASTLLFFNRLELNCHRLLNVYSCFCVAVISEKSNCCSTCVSSNPSKIHSIPFALVCSTQKPHQKEAKGLSTVSIVTPPPTRAMLPSKGVPKITGGVQAFICFEAVKLLELDLHTLNKIITTHLKCN